MYYRNANCAVVVYDITQAGSLQKARSWIRELQRQADPNILIYLCGNKLDLAANLRQVTIEEAQKYAEEEGLMWGEASAKSGEGVQQIFATIAKKLESAAPAQSAGARPGAAGARPGQPRNAGVNLNSGSTPSAAEGCNC
ncbi:GTP-binding protein of the rab/ypt [Tulasnella sp. 425]|nr:GTP-binding protein of the rab/ypt [Tulasnella sp. 425]